MFIVACLIRVCCASAASKHTCPLGHMIIKDGVVIDIIPDFIDLTRHGVIMPPPESRTSAPSYAGCAPMLVHVPVPPHILALPAPPLSPPAIVENALIPPLKTACQHHLICCLLMLFRVFQMCATCLTMIYHDLFS